MIQAVVIGNVCLDVVCVGVDDVPRHDSLEIERAVIGPGGCASNVAVGLAAQGIPTAIVARMGDDLNADLLARTWQTFGVDTRFARRAPNEATGVSVCLVDGQAVPRFIYSPGANDALAPDALDLDGLLADGLRALHVAGYFVLPGLLDERLPRLLARARARGVLTTLDVALHSRMDAPTAWQACLPHLDVFLANRQEAERLTGFRDPARAASRFRAWGARAAIVKLGAEGCHLESETISKRFAPPPTAVVDSTGAGDAFAAGLIAALLRGHGLEAAVAAANAAGAKITASLGAIAGWAGEQVAAGN